MFGLGILVVIIVAALALTLLSDRFERDRADPERDARELAETERRISEIEREANERRRD